MKRGRPAITLALIAFALLACVVVFAATTVVLVYPGNLEGWEIRLDPDPEPSPAGSPSVNFVFGPGTPPRGQGSVEFQVGPDGDNFAEIRQSNFSGTLLPNPTPSPDSSPSPTPPPELRPIRQAESNELTVLSYSTYAQSGGSGGQAPYLILNIDNNNDGVFNFEDGDDLLFFEPVYQNGTYPVVDPSITIPNQCGGNPLCVTPGQWQTWDAFNGGWWSLNAGTFGPPLTTLRFYRSQNPNARIINSPLGGVRIATGGGAGAWDNFIGNADAFTIGVGDDPDVGPATTLYDFEPEAPPAQTTGGVIISELRTSGPGNFVGDANRKPGRGVPPGRRPAPTAATGRGGRTAIRIGPGGSPPVPLEPPPCCDGDEYVELYNTSDTAISIQSLDGSAGWAVVKRGASCLATPEIVAIIPNGTVIPGRGHYLLIGNEYSLGGYPAGNGTTASGDQALSGTIEGDRSVALFNTSEASNFTPETRLDAVGFDAGSGNFCDLLAEGAKLPPPRDSTAEYAYVRRMPPNATVGGIPQDTGNNAADFFLVSTTPDQSVGDNPTPILGAPGPEGTSSPVRRNDVLTESLLAPTVARSQPPNRSRDFTIETCADFGSILIRRTFTNTTDGDITRLRFRIIDLTTFNNNGSGALADLRVLSSPNETLSVPERGTVMVQGLTLEQPPFQPSPPCGGLNSSLSAGTITTDTPIPSGGSIDVVFKLGVAQQGSFRVFVNLEALP